MGSTSPYLTVPGRLPDVIAALHLMAAAQRPEGRICYWAKELSRNESKAEIDRWTAVFRDHPEFFLVYQLEGDVAPKAALRLRYTNKLYDPVEDKEYTQERKDALETIVRDRLTTKPLTGDMITALTNTAIALHGSAITEASSRRWWVPVLAAVLGFVGAVLGSLLGHK